MQRVSNESGFRSLPGEDLIDLMVRPKESIKVAIVYQSRNLGLENIEAILDTWPNLIIEVFNLDKCEFYPAQLNDEIDIVLIDEPLKYITGSELVETFHLLLYLGVIASIKSDEQPAWAKQDFHFGGKNALFDSRKADRMFIDWMNKLIDEVEAVRLH